jgi:hypothetical protein
MFIPACKAACASTAVSLGGSSLAAAFRGLLTLAVHGNNACHVIAAASGHPCLHTLLLHGSSTNTSAPRTPPPTSTTCPP